MQASSSRRDSRSSNLTAPRKRSVGCMSGILHFLSRRSHKRLPSAPKKEKAVKTVASPLKPLISSEKRLLTEAIQVRKSDPYRTVMAPRSPPILPELRRPTFAASPGSPRPSASVMARLMGLEDGPPPPPPLESTAEKRRRLLGALERCDEDLKALRRVIEAVRCAEMRMQALEAVRPALPAKWRGAVAEDRDPAMGETRRAEVGGEQPSPSSVLDLVSSPRFGCEGFEPGSRAGSAVTTAIGSRITKPSCTSVFLLGGHCKKASQITEGHAFRGETMIEGLSIVRGTAEFEVMRCGEGGGRLWRHRRRSRASTESVEEVWENRVLEERQEWACIAARLEGDMLRDLVKEVVVELFLCYCKLSLPLRTCRKRLHF